MLYVYTSIHKLDFRTELATHIWASCQKPKHLFNSYEIPLQTSVVNMISNEGEHEFERSKYFTDRIYIQSESWWTSLSNLDRTHFSRCRAELSFCPQIPTQMSWKFNQNRCWWADVVDIHSHGILTVIIGFKRFLSDNQSWIEML